MNQVESSSCLACGHVSATPITQCPDCGGLLRGERTIRSRGWWILFFGFVLLIASTVLIVNEAINVYHAGEPGAKVKYTGGPWGIVGLFGFLGLIFSFGAGFVANGIWWTKYGRPNANLKAIVIVLWWVFTFAAGVVAWLRWVNLD